MREQIVALKVYYKKNGTIDGFNEPREGNLVEEAKEQTTLSQYDKQKEVDLIVESEIEQESENYYLNNGEIVESTYDKEVIDEFNSIYDKATEKGASITIETWNFQSYLNGESVVGNYVAKTIQDLPMTPDNYEEPDTFASHGIQPTYDAARQYANPWGNCYSTSASRINQAYEELYGVTPIDYTQNTNGTFTSADYRTASTQRGASNFGFGVGGALANGGEATLVNNDGVWAGDLKPGAALQIWHTSDSENAGLVGGHSQIFLSYTYDKSGIVNGIQVFDNSGEIETLDRSEYENNEIIRAGNLVDQK